MVRSKIAVLASLCVCAAVHAETLSFEDQKAVIDAQIELARKHDELNRVVSGGLGLPTVVSIMVLGDDRIVRLQMPNGVVSRYREGEMIRPGMVVSSIAPKQVFVSIAKDKKRVAMPLEFAAGVMPGQSAAAALAAPAPVPGALLPAAGNIGVTPIPVVPSVQPSGK